MEGQSGAECYSSGSLILIWIIPFRPINANKVKLTVTHIQSGSRDPRSGIPFGDRISKVTSPLSPGLPQSAETQMLTEQYWHLVAITKNNLLSAFLFLMPKWFPDFIASDNAIFSRALSRPMRGFFNIKPASGNDQKDAERSEEIESVAPDQITQNNSNRNGAKEKRCDKRHLPLANGHNHQRKSSAHQ